MANKRNKSNKPTIVNPVEIPCEGEAHSNGFIDHCGRCMPRWGVIVVEATDPRAVAYLASKAPTSV